MIPSPALRVVTDGDLGIWESNALEPQTELCCRWQGTEGRTGRQGVQGRPHFNFRHLFGIEMGTAALARSALKFYVDCVCEMAWNETNSSPHAPAIARAGVGQS